MIGKALRERPSLLRFASTADHKDDLIDSSIANSISYAREHLHLVSLLLREDRTLAPINYLYGIEKLGGHPEPRCNIHSWRIATKSVTREGDDSSWLIGGTCPGVPRSATPGIDYSYSLSGFTLRRRPRRYQGPLIATSLVSVAAPPELDCEPGIVTVDAPVPRTLGP